jgi:ABC-type lipopolysaccharide export system ATPase subunit
VTKYGVNHIEDENDHYRELLVTNNLLLIERKNNKNKEKPFISYQNLVHDSYRLQHVVFDQ